MARALWLVYGRELEILVDLSHLQSYLVAALASLGGAQLLLKLGAQYIPSLVLEGAMILLRQPKVKEFLKNPENRAELEKIIKDSAEELEKAVASSK